MRLSAMMATREQMRSTTRISCVMSDDGDAEAAVEVAQQFKDALGGGGVEGAGGLVAEQDLGVRGERPGDGDALLLPPESCAG